MSTINQSTLNERWIHLLHDAITAFADGNWQERTWLRGEGPDVSSYEEAMCMLFDDARFNEFISVCQKSFGFDAEQNRALAEFGAALHSFDTLVPDPSPPALILEHAEWPAVQLAARYALAAIDSVTG